jgi:hypothetical protein
LEEANQTVSGFERTKQRLAESTKYQQTQGGKPHEGSYYSHISLMACPQQGIKQLHYEID